MKNLFKIDVKSKEFLNWLPAWAVMTVIFAISAVPGQVIVATGLGKESFHVNGHFLMFFVLCFAFFKATKKLGMALFLTICYGFLDEMHQQFVPLRSVSLKDLIVDSVAGLSATLILWKLSYILPKKLKTWLFN